MKVTWYKMSEKYPPFQKIWYVDSDNMTPILYKFTTITKPSDPESVYWAYAELPEPPEEEEHSCQWEDLGKKWTCKQVGFRFHLFTQPAIEYGSIKHENAYLMESWNWGS